MPTELLSIGPLTTITQNVIYALPAVEVVLCAEGTPTFLQSNAVGFSNTIAVTLTGGQAALAGGFLKCTSGNVAVTLKRD